MQSGKRLGLSGFLVLGAILLSACGPNDSSSGASGEQESSGGSDLGKIIAITSIPDALSYIGVNKGNELGAWKGSGLEVEVIPGSSPAVLTTIASGQADIALQSANKAAADIAKGLDATIVAASQLTWGQNICVSNAGDGKNIKTVDQLRGATFGITGFGSGADYATQKVAQSMGWSKDEYKRVQLGELTAITAALESGAIDASIFNPLGCAAIEEEGVAHDIGSADEYVGAVAGSLFYVRNETLKERPEAVKQFFEGYFGLIEKLKADPTPARQVLIDDFKASPEAVDRTYEGMLDALSTDGRMSEQVLKGVADAVTFTFPDIESIDVGGMYTPWQEIR